MCVVGAVGMGEEEMVGGGIGEGGGNLEGGGEGGGGEGLVDFATLCLGGDLEIVKTCNSR